MGWGLERGRKGHSDCNVKTKTKTTKEKNINNLIENF